MAVDITEAAKNWSAEHPQAVEALTPLVRRGAAIFSSTYHDVVARALDLPRSRRPGDIDLLMPSQAFGRAARHLGAAAVVGDVKFQTRDGQPAQMYAREALAYIGGDEVQFLDPLGRLCVGSESSYDTRFTPQAVAARTVVETDEGILAFAHPIETIGMYAMLQRGGAKNDAGHAATLLAATAALEGDYAFDRAVAMGWDARVWRFIGDASAAAAGAQVVFASAA
ncbi:MAG TPA: hypothetical protein VF466_03150 [Candidatus Saccharimonadales bacterium]